MFFNNTLDVIRAITNKDFEKLILESKILDEKTSIKVINEYNNGNPSFKATLEMWQKSILEGKPDYSVYSKEEYLNEAFESWICQSRRYLLRVKKYLQQENCQLKNIDTILDLGCGIAYSTILLSNLFKDKVKVYGTNVENSLQFKIDEFVTSNFSNIEIIPETKTLNLNTNIDLVFASEFFEHLEYPIELLQNLIRVYKPKYFLIANSFNVLATGHFLYYYNVENNLLGKMEIKYNGKEMSKKFNLILKENNYESIKTGFWNNRPNLWKLRS